MGQLKTVSNKNKVKFNRCLSIILIVITSTLIISIPLGLFIFNRHQPTLAETTERLLNPGIGFYRTAPFKLDTSNSGGTDITLSANYNLHHLRIDLSAFAKVNNNFADIELTDQALNKLDENLKKLYEHEKCAIVRFAYDKFNGVANKEPSESMILRHIEQISSVLNRYPYTISAIEVGMVGMWGEMHTSTLANLTTIDHLIDQFLICTNDFPILVRTPKMIYHYLGISLADIDHYRIPSNSPAYRLSIFNDGYLGSSSDLGTYTNREKEIEWLSYQTLHLPYGGEVMDTELSNFENCLDEMRQIHLSYLNYEWNNRTTQQKWVTTFCTKALKNDAIKYQLTSPHNLMTAQQYIENRMGYRFLVKEQKIQVTNHQLQLYMKIINIGFGNLSKTAHATIILQNQKQQNFYFPITESFTGQGNYNLKINHELAAGEYKVYYCPHLDFRDNLPYYTIAFANQQMYDTNLKANLLGTAIIN